MLPHQRPVYWLTHGALLFLTVGFYLGMAARNAMAGALGGASIGLAAAVTLNRL